jgi:hypothetical protein
VASAWQSVLLRVRYFLTFYDIISSNPRHRSVSRATGYHRNIYRCVSMHSCSVFGYQHDLVRT